MICLFGLYRSGDCSRSHPRRQFHTTALFSGRNRPRFGRERWIPSVVPKMRSRPFSRFAKIKYPIIFLRHSFSQNSGKTREIQTMRTFWWAFTKKRLQCYKIVYCTSDTGVPGPRTVFSLAPSSLWRTNISGPGPPVSPIQYIIIWHLLAFSIPQYTQGIPVISSGSDFDSFVYLELPYHKIAISTFI